MQLFAGWKFCASFCAINTFFICVCWYIETFVDDMQTIFYEIELHLKTNNSANNLKIFAIRRALSEAVEFHVKIFEYVLVET